MIRVDLTGRKFGYLTVIRPLEKRYNSNVVWACQCDCGKTHNVTTTGLTAGHTKSCGCQHHPIKHGETKHRLYSIHRCMKRRCYDSSHASYPNYGGRGITICDEWLYSYENFSEWAKKNGYEDGLTIERLDNNKGYSPDNCTWITRAEQNRNQRNTILK